MSLADYPEIKALSAWERLQLVDELWTQLSHEIDSLEASSEEKHLLDARWQQYLNDPVTALSLDEFKARLRARRA